MLCLRLLAGRTLTACVRNYSHRPEMSQAASFLDFGTRRIFAEEHDLFRETVRKFVAEHIVPHHTRWEEQGHCDRELWLKAGEQSLLGIATPEADGGHGGDILSAAIVWEELNYANCSGPGFPLHSDIVM
ncbi:Acyl-CoA dehydrogenase, partial [Paragonimus heterotremus]